GHDDHDDDDSDTAEAKVKRECPLCGEKKSNMVSHLKKFIVKILVYVSTQIWNLFNSPVHVKYENRFEELDDPGAEFVELRDYLMTMLLVQNAQRPGAVCNLTVDEFHAGEWDDSTGVKQFVTLTKRHKTACRYGVTGKRIRKSAVSRHRQLADSGGSSGPSKDELARQMSHSTLTAEGHYAMRDTVKGRAKASNFLRHIAPTTPQKGSPKSRKTQGSWKYVERRRVSPEKSLGRGIRK
ncbi:Hypothetical predicted protein, partial [Paramuricea clavata]